MRSPIILAGMLAVTTAAQAQKPRRVALDSIDVNVALVDSLPVPGDAAIYTPAHGGRRVILLRAAKASPASLGPALALMQTYAAAGNVTDSLDQFMSLTRVQLYKPLDPAIEHRLAAHVARLQSAPRQSMGHLGQARAITVRIAHIDNRQPHAPIPSDP